MNYHMMQDAPQRALGFLIQQASLIEPTVYQVRYQDIQYQQLIPVDTSAPEWIQSVTYFSGDAVGAAQWFSGKAQDVPNVELLREKFETTVSMAAIGYRYDLEELGKAMMLNMNLNADKATAARRISEEFIDKVAIGGDAAKGLSGLVNNGAASVSAASISGVRSRFDISTELRAHTGRRLRPAS